MNQRPLILFFLGFTIFVLIGSQFNLFGTSNADSFPKLPSKPDFTVSHQFDGQWLGRRVNTTNNNMCERTTITGRVVDGKVSLLLTYNGTPLQGWIAENGDLKLYANHRQWDYRFSGKANSNKIQGKWHLTNGPCQGTWYIERKS